MIIWAQTYNRDTEVCSGPVFISFESFSGLGELLLLISGCTGNYHLGVTQDWPQPEAIRYILTLVHERFM